MRNQEPEAETLSRDEAAAVVRHAVRASARRAVAAGGGPAAASRYAILIPLRGGDALAYHTATQAFARWGAEDLAVWSDVEAGRRDVSDPELGPFLDGGFVVSSINDERDEIERQLDASRFDPSGMVLTVAPTMGCNFACAYCFQGLLKPTNRINEEVMDALVAYLDRKTRTLSRLHIAWYGGEPLMHKQGIYAMSDRIIPICRKNNCHYSAFIVTNGYFLDLKTAQELCARGVGTCQVTLDGSADSHDGRRHLTSGKPTYERICRNLDEVVEHTDLMISIRVNIDSANAPDAVRLLDDLQARRLNRRGTLGVYFAPVEAITNACASCDEDSFAKTDYGQLEADLYRAAFERGLSALPRPPLFHGNCGAVRRNGLVLTPSGDLHKCWDTVMQPELRIGSIHDVEEAEASPISKAWLDWSPFKNAVCRECPILPSCAGACAFKFVHPDQTQGEGGALPCPSWKFNLAERMFLRAEKLGVVTADEWDPVLSPTRAEAALKTGRRHDFDTIAEASAAAAAPVAPAPGLTLPAE
ncbi:MAG: SPASM domain-containing protein [Pseudomonadota bacterium]